MTGEIIDVVFADERKNAEWSLHRDDVEQVLRTGEVIDSYLNDTPYPSYLMLGRLQDGRPPHVVAADDNVSEETHVITTYVLTPERWTEDFRTRTDKDNGWRAERCNREGFPRSPALHDLQNRSTRTRHYDHGA